MSEPIAFPTFPKPTVRVVLWEGPGRPTEETIRERLVAEGYGVVKWTVEPATGYPPHAHIYPGDNVGDRGQPDGHFSG